MIKVIGVRFRTAGKIYFFDPLDFEVERGGHVIVETARGIEFGTVVSAPREVEDDKVIQPLKPVLRVATQKDIEQEAENKIKEKEAFQVCLEKIRKHELDMKLIDAEYTFDNNKVLFYFTADGRIDFRELVKDLASVFKTRIELRQIGVRDETKIRGGIGICGRPLCCHTHLSDFIPVSIKMAKEQNLSLNPTKISGVCGRLMCCLKHEEETYEELNRNLPNVGDTVTTEDGLQGEVQSVNVLRQLVKVVVDINDEKEIHEYKVEDLRFKRRHGKREKVELSAEEMKELAKLEEEEQVDGVEDKPASAENRNNHRENRQDRGGRREKFHKQEPDTAEGEETQSYDNRRGNRNNRNRRDNYQNDGQENGANTQQGHRRDHRFNDNRGNRRYNRQDGSGEQPAMESTTVNGENGAQGENHTQGENHFQGEHRGNRNYRGRNRHYNRNKKEGKSNFEGNQS